MHRIRQYSVKVSTREKNKQQCFTRKRRYEESLLLDTSIILKTCSSINNASRSSHRDVLCKIAVLPLLSKKFEKCRTYLHVFTCLTCVHFFLQPLRTFTFLHALPPFTFLSVSNF